MNPIENEISRLLRLAGEGALPGYPDSPSAGGSGMEEHFSGENDALARRLQLLWKNEPQLLQCIPLIIAAVEKNRTRTSHAIEHTELYNYTI